MKSLWKRPAIVMVGFVCVALVVVGVFVAPQVFQRPTTSAAGTLVSATNIPASDCSSAIVVAGDSAPDGNTVLAGNPSWCAVVTFPATQNSRGDFGRSLTVVSPQKNVAYAVYYIDDQWPHYNSRLVILGSNEERSSSLASLSPSKHWWPEAVVAFVPVAGATELPSATAVAIISRILPIDQSTLFAFGDASVNDAAICATLSDALAPK